MNNELNFQSDIPNPYNGFEPVEKKRKNGYAIASLVFGILSVLACCCCCASAFGIIAMGISAILAIVFAFLSKKNAGGKMDATAIAGLVLGIVSIVVIICFAAAVVGVFAMTDTVPQSEMMTFLEENVKPAMEGNEASYNKIVEAIEAIYAAKTAN